MGSNRLSVQNELRISRMIYKTRITVKTDVNGMMIYEIRISKNRGQLTAFFMNSIRDSRFSTSSLPSDTPG
ncbi:hypothetical protein SDC9_100021 [bioreactor metagenome]|uniref:Uncharacterized protein n=1 Tax=bioreactor metagenome TaxID=1076179 RepID=A0A645AJ53_9ZZZZ